MINIIVVGYPKSGSTWITRLVAELVQCPLAGFFGDDTNNIDSEGLDRDSDYQCFKAHHQLSELREIVNKQKNSAQVFTDYKIIYVIRDPRDVCLSGTKFFKIERFHLLGKYIRGLPTGEEMYRLINYILSPPKYRIKQMMEAVINGSQKVHWWVRISWKNHYKPYWKNSYFFVRYEDMLDHPEQECRRILAFLEIERDEQQIQRAIEIQSFENKKEFFLKSGQIGKAGFLRVGKKEQWKKKCQISKNKFSMNI